MTQVALARALGLTPARVNQLIQEEIVRRDEKDASGGVFLFQSVVNYLQFQFKQSKSDETNYFLEKARHEKVKRQIAELKLSKEEGRTYDAATVEAVMIEQLVGLRTHLLGMGMKLAGQLVGKTAAEISDIINREVEDRLTELSNYNPEMFKSEDGRRIDAGDA